MPNITGKLPSYGITTPAWYSGAFINDTAISRSMDTGSGACEANFDASRVSGAYGAGGAQRVRPRAFGALACVYLGS